MPPDGTPPRPRPSDPPRRRLVCFFGLCRCWKLMRLLAAGDPLSDHGAGCGPREPVALACGVVTYASSISSSIRSSSELDDESEGTIPGTLPSDPERHIFSCVPMTDHSELDDCSVPLKSPLLLPGIFTPRPPIVGLESGLDWSASVEWCRCVAAREKSRPLDLRGRMFVGDAKTCEWSSLGLSGPPRPPGCVLPGPVPAGEKSRLCESCRLRSRREILSRRGVEGAEVSDVLGLETDVFLRELSSFALRVGTMWGEGESFAEAEGSPSESERGLEKGERGIRWESAPWAWSLMSSSASMRAASKNLSRGGCGSIVRVWERSGYSQGTGVMPKQSGNKERLSGGAGRSFAQRLVEWMRDNVSVVASSRCRRSAGANLQGRWGLIMMAWARQRVGVEQVVTDGGGRIVRRTNEVAEAVRRGKDGG